MRRTEVINGLLCITDNGQRGRKTIAWFFAQYLNDLQLSAKERIGAWRFETDLPQLLVGALETFRCSTDPRVVAVREKYEHEVGYAMPDLMTPSGDLVKATITLDQIGHIFYEVTGNALVESDIRAALNAQLYLIKQHSYMFAHKVYSRGLAQLVNTSNVGLRGVFGETTLLAMVTSKMIITLERSGNPEPHAITLVCNPNDPLGLGIGIAAVETDIHTVLVMLEDVIEGWPLNIEEVRVKMIPDRNISLG